MTTIQAPAGRVLQALLVALLFGTVVLGSTGLFAAANRVQPMFGWPLPKSEQRPQLLTFGMFVTPDPARNPIDPPERFTGYHTGQDFELLPGEEDMDVPVFAVCDGEVLVKEHAEGYGGVVVQRCERNGKPLTVLYGHLSLQRMTKKKGDTLQQGEKFAFLAPPKSEESGFTRKHLHLGVHNGARVEMLGYVQSKQALDAFVDPLTVLGK